MSAKSKIEWTEATWNPVRGCTRISPGCVNCYAERMAARDLPGLKSPTTKEPFAIITPSGPRWTGKVKLIPHMLDVPLKRRKPTTYFVNSMSDLFHESLPDEDIDRVFAVMALCPRHTFQVLTKRADRMRAYVADDPIRRGYLVDRERERIYNEAKREAVWYPTMELPLPNVHIGVSVENQEYADKRIPDLLATPAAVRFVSYEPALGPVDFGLCRWVRLQHAVCSDLPPFLFERDEVRSVPAGIYRADSNPHGALAVRTSAGKLLGIKPGEFERLPKIDQIIIGGESGPGARPIDIQWARNTIEQCKAAGVACFVKQLGARPVALCNSCKPTMRGFCRLYGAETRRDGFEGHGMDGLQRLFLKDRKGGDMSEWSADLRVRQTPEVRA